MLNRMTRLSFRLTEDLKRKAMAVAAAHGIFSYTDVLKQALELWVVCMRNKTEILHFIETHLNSVEPGGEGYIEEMWTEVANALEED
jgi:hypothetical protein